LVHDHVERLLRVLRPVSDEQEANAAVAMLLKPQNSEFSLLFVKRVNNPSDPWSGQVAFPGGKHDPTDLSLKQTVVRETLEETGISLLAGCRFLGVLTALMSRPRPDIRVLPFVVLFEREQPIKLNKDELEGFFWSPLKEIVRGKGQARLSFGDVPAYVVGSTVIWGLTYKMLEDFFRVFNSG
jgi:8-oxo-dGTP diphosphatase